MSEDEVTAAFGARDATRRALRGWQQRIQAVLDIARDDDDLAVRLPVLDQLAAELVAALGLARAGLEAASGRLPAEADALRRAVRDAHELLHGIDLWHRPPSVAALRKARDRFRVAAERLDD
jgi:hypothetical protein